MPFLLIICIYRDCLISFLFYNSSYNRKVQFHCIGKRTLRPIMKRLKKIYKKIKKWTDCHIVSSVLLILNLIKYSIHQSGERSRKLYEERS